MYLPRRTDLRLACLAASLVGLVVFAAPARAQSGDNVLLVVNDSSQASVRIGDYYAGKRGVPPSNVVRLKVDAKDVISAADFARLVQAPIAAWFGRQAAHDRILYIVLTKGIPLRVAGTSGRRGTTASVDSELALLYRRLTGSAVPLDGPVANPYFLGDAPLSDARPFTHRRQDVFLVTRLDGFTVEDVLALIDRGLTAAGTGRFLFDERAPTGEKGDAWLAAAAKWLTANGFEGRVKVDATSEVLADEPDVIGYCSWGSNDPANRRRHLGLGFRPGAIALTFLSNDARTFTPPPPDWQPGSRDDARAYYAGSPQSLAGDLVRDGVTGVAGQVSEPYLDGTIRPDILFPAYAMGFNLAESYYLALPYVGWQTVVVGDPLCTPFSQKRTPAGAVDEGTDPATGLPAFFAGRRLEQVMTRTSNRTVATLIVKAEGCLARGDSAGARTSLERAVSLEPAWTEPRLTLATLYEQGGEFDKAIEVYRRVVEIESTNTQALNNLAYALATRRQQPREALPFAERAYTLSNGRMAAAADTLGWIHHLLGDDRRAADLLAAATKAAPENGEMQFHLATVLAARGLIEPARAALAKAIELAPEIETRSDVGELRGRLKVDPKREES